MTLKGIAREIMLQIGCYYFWFVAIHCLAEYSLWTEITVESLVQLHNVKSKNKSVTLYVYVFKYLCTKRLITKRLCHTTKTVIKRKTSQKENLRKCQTLQNITSHNENCHKTTRNVYPNLTLDMVSQIGQQSLQPMDQCAVCGQSHQTEVYQPMDYCAVCPNLT
jgi:hypothetical protein